MAQTLRKEVKRYKVSSVPSLEVQLLSLCHSSHALTQIKKNMF